MGNIKIKGSVFRYVSSIETRNTELPKAESVDITEDAIRALRAYVATAEFFLLDSIETAKVTSDDTILYRHDDHTCEYSTREIATMESIADMLEDGYDIRMFKYRTDYSYIAKAFAMMPKINFTVEKGLAMDILMSYIFCDRS